jgi:hypothetical protein
LAGDVVLSGRAERRLATLPFVEFQESLSHGLGHEAANGPFVV